MRDGAFRRRGEPAGMAALQHLEHFVAEEPAAVLQFREVGAVFVHVVNREYCKKLGVMVPGQRHPVHHHQRKEETFQLLWGDLSVQRDGEVFDLQPGDKLVIERGMPHAFWSRNGGIFEEISTTDVRGDSHYEDAAINRLDPMQRKTFLESW